MSAKEKPVQSAPKNVWITGASRGIGAALSVELASRGWGVVLTARDRGRLEEVAKRCLDRGAPSALVLPGDVTDAAKMSEIAAQAKSSLGEVGAAVLNAGILEPFEVHKFNAEVFRRHLDVHVMGAVNCIQAVLGDMLESNSGTLVFIASLAGLVPLPKSAPYCAAKSALVSLAESLRIDLRGTDVKVVLANPGFVDTDMTAKNEFPMPFMVRVERAAQIIADALERQRPEVSFPFPLVLPTKSLALFPGSLRRSLLAQVLGRMVTSPPGGSGSGEDREV